MKIPRFVTIPLLAVLACLGWHNQQRLDELHSTHARLASRTPDHGVLLDSATPDGAVRFSKGPRPDRVAEAKRVAAALVGYAAELPLPDTLSAEDKQRRVLVETERVLALNGSQLKSLIAELQAAVGMDAKTRIYFIRFAIGRLIKTHPQDALAILLEAPELDPADSYNYPPRDPYNVAMRAWAKLDPHAAQAWLQENRDHLAAPLASSVRNALIDGAAAGDPMLALQLFSESGRAPRELSTLIERDCHSAVERLAFLAAWREWRATLPTGAIDKDVTTACLAALAYGAMEDRPVAFKATSECLTQAQFTPAEMERLTVMDFAQYLKPEETGQWLEWLEKSWPEKYATSCRQSLMRSLQSSVAAAEWLMQQPDSPRRREMVGECADEAFLSNRETSIRLVLSLPAGEERQRLLAQLYFIWPKEKPEDKAAAEAFAKEHGLEE